MATRTPSFGRPGRARHGWLRKLVGAWRPFHGRGMRMSRGRFWAGTVLLLLVGLPVNLVTMQLGAEGVLLGWYVLCAVLLVPASLRRADDSALARPLMLLELLPLLVAAVAALMVPLISLDGHPQTTYAAVSTSLLLWIPCLLPAVFLCSRPSTSVQRADVLGRGL
jgi:uncharacterized membrane protein YhaH (DUF805 family)